MSTPAPTVFTVTSPDGFPLERDVAYYATREAALLARELFVERFRHQGYYLNSSRERISLDELPEHCEVGEHPATDFSDE